jgi:hypothetical protein
MLLFELSDRKFKLRSLLHYFLLQSSILPVFFFYLVLPIGLIVLNMLWCNLHGQVKSVLVIFIGKWSQTINLVSNLSGVDEWLVVLTFRCMF